MVTLSCKTNKPFLPQVAFALSVYHSSGDQTRIVTFICHEFGLLGTVSSPPLAWDLFSSFLWIVLVIPRGFIASRRHLSSESLEVYSPLT